MPSNKNVFKTGIWENLILVNNLKPATKDYNCSKDTITRKTCEEGVEPCDFAFINEGQEDQMDIYGYCKHSRLTIVCWLFTAMTMGAMRLVFHWWPHLMLYSTHARCPLKNADKLLIVEHPKKSYSCFDVQTVKTLTSKNLQEEFKKLQHSTKTTKSVDCIKRINTEEQILSEKTGEDLVTLRMFELKNQRYIWDDNQGNFLKLSGLDNNIRLSCLHQQTGLTAVERKIRQLIYGKNKIAVPMQGVIELFVLEILNPFYVFQLFSFGLWFAYEYVSYAVAILIMSAFSIIMAVIQTSDTQKKLHSTVHSSDVISVVKRDDSGSAAQVSWIPTEQLVPGDLIMIPPRGCNMYCDAVLLSGSCVVNESILTGESVPVTKIPLPYSPWIVYDTKEHAKNTLFSGTRVIKTRSQSDKDILAVVIRTGFSTAKGELVRSILYPMPISFKFEEDSYKYIQLMAGVASVGFLYTVITKLMRGVAATTVALEALDLVTIVVPPALPAAMAVGCMSAQARLRKNNIFCVSPKMITVAGCINCVCFDKTGTLTEDGMDMWGVVPVKNKVFDAPVKNVSNLQSDDMLHAMAASHSLTVVDGKICGDPLDIKMFEWTDWILEEPNKDKSTSNSIQTPLTRVCPKKHSDEKDTQEIEILHLLPFSSNFQRMAVVTKLRKREGKEDSCFKLDIYSKGSPEAIKKLCNPNSIPKDFERKLEEYTTEGYRVLGIAHKSEDLNISQVSREVIEKDLNFLGLIIFDNRLKPQTAGVIRALQSANIRPVMVTGDNQETALSVARECGIIPPSQTVFVVDVTPPSGVEPARVIYRMCQTSYSDKTTPENLINGSKIEVLTTESGSKGFDYGDIPPTPDMTLALTGTMWDLLHSHLPAEVPAIVNRCVVFSRMSPDHKQQLVLCLQSLGCYVAMCGDGANDCGALKAAHTGISLSEAESSVASPFTSRGSTVDCVIKVIQEGRAALVTSFAIFKFMAGYSLVQFLSVMILYSIDSNLTDMQYLFVDLFVISVLAFLLGRTEANSGPLVPRPPEISLLSPTPIASLIGQVAIVAVFQFICFYSLSKYDWYQPYDATKPTGQGPGCFENFALFAISTVQYVILAVVFCKGAPYRAPLSKNWSLWSTATAITAFVSYLILWPNQWFQDIFELVVPPDMTFRVFCVILCGANFILAGIYEFYVCDILITNKTRSTDIFGTKKEKDV